MTDVEHDQCTLLTYAQKAFDRINWQSRCVINIESSPSLVDYAAKIVIECLYMWLHFMVEYFYSTCLFYDNDSMLWRIQYVDISCVTLMKWVFCDWFSKRHLETSKLIFHQIYWFISCRYLAVGRTDRLWWCSITTRFLCWCFSWQWKSCLVSDWCFLVGL